MLNLQARIDKDGAVLTLCELPIEFWPDSWFKDGNRNGQPLFWRPVVILRYAIPGHPKSGYLWEEHLTEVLVEERWNKVEDWNGVYTHPDGSIFIVYVDDLLLVAPEEAKEMHWKRIGDKIQFKEESQEVTRYLGAHYELTPYKHTQPNAVRRKDYVLKATGTF